MTIDEEALQSAVQKKLALGPARASPGDHRSATDGFDAAIDYKQFGVRLNFLPVVLGDGRIRLKVSPEVSDLDLSYTPPLGSPWDAVQLGAQAWTRQARCLILPD